MDRLVRQVARATARTSSASVDLDRAPESSRTTFPLDASVVKCPKALAVLDGDLINHPFHRLEGDAVDFLNGDGGLFVVGNIKVLCSPLATVTS